MNKLNPELTAQVQALAQLVGRKLQRENFDLDENAKPMLAALVLGGFHRLSDANLQMRLESGVLEEFAKTAIHRRGELAGITGSLQSSLNELVRWKTSGPDDANPIASRSEAAKISAANEA